MMNINILNKVINGITEQIPLVNSFYTQSPYESWNCKEIKYGSVSFVVTKTTTRNSVTTYDAVIYYADRLIEDKSNRDSIHSDAATVIQTIVGALNQHDNEYLEVEYPVGITLFEQSFSDELAGGYANLIINVEGMSECFDNEYNVPEIIGTSAYYTKEQITELFPLKSQLSTVAFSGSFRDLLDIPPLTTEIQYNQLVNNVSELTRMTETLNNTKVDKTTFNEVIKSLGGDLSGVVTKQQFDSFINGQNQINTNLAVELKNKVSSAFFQEQMNLVDTKINNSITKSQFDNFVNGQNQINTNLAVELGDKLGKEYFNGWKDNVLNTLETKVSRQSFDTAMANVYTKSDVDNLVSQKVDKVVSEYIKSDEIDDIVNDSINEAIKNITTDVTESVRVELDSMVSEEIESQIGNFVTEDELEDAIAEQYDNYIGTEEFKDELKTVVESTVDELVGDVVTELELESKNYASKYYVDDKISKIDLSDYPTKTEVSNTYPTKTEVSDKYATKSNLSSYLTKSDASNTYYTQSQVNSKIKTVNDKFGNYYTRNEIDVIIDNIQVGEDTDLSDYPTKTEVENVYCKKSDTYTKTEIETNYYNKSQIDGIVGNIDTVLNDILYA